MLRRDVVIYSVRDLGAAAPMLDTASAHATPSHPMFGAQCCRVCAQCCHACTAMSASVGWPADVQHSVSLQPDHRGVEHGERFEHVLCMLLANRMRTCGLIALGGASSTEPWHLWLLLPCARPACSGAVAVRARYVLCCRVHAFCWHTSLAAHVAPCGFGSQMFVSAAAFNQNIASWNTATVTNMSKACPIAAAVHSPHHPFGLACIAIALVARCTP